MQCVDAVFTTKLSTDALPLSTERLFQEECPEQPFMLMESVASFAVILTPLAKLNDFCAGNLSRIRL